MDRKRKFCQGARNCYYETDTTYKKNIGISQPKEAPKNLNREKALKSGFSLQATASVLNNLFSSNGLGAPDSQNRKQTTLAHKDKQEKSQVNSSWKPGISFAKGYITKYQGKLEANVGAMDRLERLKAKAVANSK